MDTEGVTDIPPWKADSMGLAGAASLDVLMAEGRGPLPEVPKREPYVGSAVPELPWEAEPMPLPGPRAAGNWPIPGMPEEAGAGGAFPAARCGEGAMPPATGPIMGMVAGLPALSRLTELRPADAALPKPRERTESPPPTLIASPELGMPP